jgi:hypothetical protein
VRYACEACERRILLSTFTINGTNAADTWQLSADAGVVTVDGVTTTNASITDVQVNGLDGNDTLFVIHANIPVVFNGGNHDDQLFASPAVGLMTQEVHTTLTFNGGPGNDLADGRDDNYAAANSYTYSSASFGWGTGNLTWNATVENLYMSGGPGGSTVSVAALSVPVGITINGNTGSDSVTVDMAGSTGTVGIVGGNGAGTDSMTLNDAAVIGPITYTIGTGTVLRSGRTIQHAGLESVTLNGVSASAGTYNVTGANAASTAITLNGGGASDTFNVTSSQDANLTIAGGGGTLDALVIDDRTHPLVISQGNAGPDHFTRYWGALPNPSNAYELGYTGIEAWTYFAKNSTTVINVFGTPSSIPAGQQATIFCGANADTVNLYPHDANGNLSINGNLGLSGGGGADKLIVEDAASSSGIDYDITNTFGPTTQNIYGMGTRGFGAANDVETLELRAGNGEDTFALNTFQSGAALIVSGGGGYDTFDISPTAHNLPAAITNMSFFSYDGGTGDDHFNVLNDNNTSAWTITRTATQLSYSAPSTGYFIVFNLSHLGYMFASGGTVVDTYLIRSTPADNMNNDLYGAGGSDTYTFGNSGLTSGIASYCNVNGSGGTDSIVIDDSADIVGRTFHVNSGFINAVPGDTLFPAAGGDIYGIVVPSSVTGSITIKLGSGADTINFAPVAVGDGTYSIQANSPTSGSGDTLNLAFAGATSPIFTSQGTGNGTYTFSNRATFSYTGIETKTIDSVAPTFISGQYDYDAANGSSINLQYSENVSPGLYNTHFNLFNQTTATSIPFGTWAYTYDAGTNTVHYTFPGLPGGVLPDGSYTTSSTRVTDAAGNTLVGPVQYNFIWSAGTALADTFRVDTDVTATTTRVYQNDDVTPAFTATAFSLNLVFIAGGDDDDAVVIDATNGNPYAASGIVLDGGIGVDSLRVQVTDLVDNVSYGAGAVVIDGGQVAHSAVEQFAYTGGSEHFVALTVDAGSVTVNGIDRFESLSIADGAALIAEPGNSSALVVRALNVLGAGRLDLTNNSLILPNDTAAAVQVMLAAGFNQGHWNGGGGINSSSAGADATGLTALGCADNAILNRTVFAGVSGLDGTEILVKYTYYGDADLNGATTLDDFTLFLNGYQNSGTTWVQGDYDYSGLVTLDDFTLFLAGYQQQGPPL